MEDSWVSNIYRFHLSNIHEFHHNTSTIIPCTRDQTICKEQTILSLLGILT